MKKTNLLLISAAAVLLLTVSLHAQPGGVDPGCGNSPENPTVVLALVGSAGAVVASVRSRIRARRQAK